jgi:hypothetical protein
MLRTTNKRLLVKPRTTSTTFCSLRDGATVVTSGMSHVRFDAR